MKPHEEEWEVFKGDAGGWVASHRGDGPIVVSAFGQTVTQQKERAALIAAAPDMARRLLAGMENGHRRDCPHSLRRFRAVAVPCSEDCEHDRAALTKAGVPIS